MQKELTPEETLAALAGKEPSWVPESRLPLWMLKNYEERVRREAAVASAVAARQAMQGTSSPRIHNKGSNNEGMSLRALALAAWQALQDNQRKELGVRVLLFNTCHAEYIVCSCANFKGMCMIIGIVLESSCANVKHWQECTIATGTKCKRPCGGALEGSPP